VWDNSLRLRLVRELRGMIFVKVSAEKIYKPFQTRKVHKQIISLAYHKGLTRVQHSDQ